MPRYQKVSIRTRPEERVIPAGYYTSSVVIYDVSIRTRPEERVILGVVS